MDAIVLNIEQFFSINARSGWKFGVCILRMLLKRLGCALVHGHYFCRPLHPSDYEAAFLLNSER